MGKQIQLQQLLEELVESENVYFQPPPTFKMEYPCIVYSRNNIVTTFANDKPYNHVTGYQLKVLDYEPDGNFIKKVSTLPMCSFERHYTVDNLNHDVYNIFY